MGQAKDARRLHGYLGLLLPGCVQVEVAPHSTAGPAAVLVMETNHRKEGQAA